VVSTAEAGFYQGLSRVLIGHRAEATAEPQGHCPRDPEMAIRSLVNINAWIFCPFRYTSFLTSILRAAGGGHDLFYVHSQGVEHKT
jgi:hypothetical protein